MEYEKVTKKNLLQKVHRELLKLPPCYVVCVDYRQSRGAANVNIGGTKFEIKVKVFDSDLKDWTHQPNVFNIEFEDSDGTHWWDERFNYFKEQIQTLISKKQC